MGVRAGHAVRLPVALGLIEGPRTEILSGLKDDEIVVKGECGIAHGRPSPSSPAAPEQAPSTVAKP